MVFHYFSSIDIIYQYFIPYRPAKLVKKLQLNLAKLKSIFLNDLLFKSIKKPPKGGFYKIVIIKLYKL
tara:strand:+ start:414 stop:617 length:204 start_codon:yes stop_codon:yes gene_type:complete